MIKKKNILNIMLAMMAVGGVYSNCLGWSCDPCPQKKSNSPLTLARTNGCTFNTNSNGNYAICEKKITCIYQNGRELERHSNLIHLHGPTDGYSGWEKLEKGDPTGIHCYKEES